MNDLDQRMIRELRPMLREMRDTNPARYRELFANLIPPDALCLSPPGACNEWPSI
jgi:hypothetical protein